MTVAIVCIGTELLRGEIENTNASWLCREVVALGRAVGTIETIADDADVIAATLSRLGKDHDLLVCTGGLGPTTDDITSAVVAELVGVNLERDADVLAGLEERYRSRGITLNDGDKKQADFPKGATVRANDWGTAPGFSIAIEGALSFFFPGVPREMHPMFERYVVPELKRGMRTHTAQVRVRTFGAPESRVNHSLRGVEEQFDVTIGYRAHFPEIDVKPMATCATKEEAERRVRAAADEIRRRLGALVYGEGDVGMPETVLNLLRERKMWLGLAESCTGGLVASLLTEHSCSDVFLGGVVCYANSVKVGALGVDPQTLQSEGAVSEETVRQMARGAIERLGCDISLALSGVAGPGGGTEEKPVGLVHFAVATRDQVVCRQRTLQVDRIRVQRWAAYAGLDLVRKMLTGDAE